MSELTGLTAIGYCRISTDDKGQTVDTQKHLINEWAKRHGVIIREIFADEGVSGSVFPRPELAQALIEIKTYQIPILVCLNQSRLTRDSSAHMPHIKRILGDSCVIRYVELDMPTDDLGGQMTLAVTGILDAEERRRISKRTKDRMDNLKLQGRYLGRPAAFMFREDVTSAPQGLFKAGRTLTLSKPELMEYAKAGRSISWVCKNVLIRPDGGHVTTATLCTALRNAGLFDEYEHKHKLAAASVKRTDRTDSNEVGA